jgi:hypothetical protein
VAPASAPAITAAAITAFGAVLLNQDMSFPPSGMRLFVLPCFRPLGRS